MLSLHAWIFQATPATLDLTAELRVGDALSWSIARHGRAVRPGDRVYYWQSGRDAGIYGLGRVDAVSAKGAEGRYAVRTIHERALFAPIARAELRADAVLHGLAVLRQPRGTVFPLTPAEDVALARRTGGRILTLAVPSSRRRAGTLRVSGRLDGELPRQLAVAHEQGDEVVIVFVQDGEPADTARVAAVRARRNGDVDLRLLPLEGDFAAPLPADAALAVASGHVTVIADAPDPAAPAVAAPAPAWVTERAATYRAAQHFDPAPREILGELELPGSLVAQVVAAVNAGQHIMLMGLPGTGKTTLALNLAEAAARAGLCAGRLAATATADWTTFDTVGGLVPDRDGTLRFAEGVALRAIREDRWLVLDELNRADIDKAFGPLLTVLSGGPVDLPTITVDGRPVRIEPVDGRSGRSGDGCTYRVGSQWRIIATMNTMDRAALFSFSLAFARRFAFVLVPLPQPQALIEVVRRRINPPSEAVAMLEHLIRSAPRPLGPAILLDTARYIAARAEPAALAEAVGAFVLPQLEGIDRASALLFVHTLGDVLGQEAEAILQDYVDALFGAS